MSTLPPDAETEVLAGEYVLGLLPPDQSAAIERELPQAPALALAVAGWSRRLLPLTSLVAPLRPRADLWSRIERRLDDARAAVPRPSTLPRPRRRRQQWWALAASLALLVSAALLGPRLLAPDRVAVAFLAAPDGAAGWRVEAYSDRRLRVRPLAPAATPVPEGRSLQLWTKRNNVEGPVSLGLMDPRGADRVSLGALPAPVDGQLFELTLEPVGGSPVGHPTGPVLFKGYAARTS